MWNAIVDEKYIKRTHILIENIYNVLSKIELFNNDYTQYESNNLIPGSVSKGTIGPALFFYYFDKSFNINKSKHLISKFGTHSFNTLANPWISTTLFEGSIGILLALIF